jgi:nitrile hydratase subunit beta
MDGIHDLGGMHGFGPVRVERDEPVFHARWEGRVLALTGATGGSFTPNVDKFRHAIERLDPVTYLTAGYYGRWLLATETRLVEAGELEPGAVDRRARELALRLERAGDATGAIATTSGATSAAAEPADAAQRPGSQAPPADRPRPRFRREVDRAPRFRAGDAVRARSFHPPGHTRLPRYARGKRGRIETVYAAYVFPDTHAHDRGEEPQYAYCVAFTGEELWGPDAEPGTLVHLDLFEPYLEPDEER